MSQFKAQLVAKVMAQCLGHDWLRGQTVQILWKKVALISKTKSGMVSVPFLNVKISSAKYISFHFSVHTVKRKSTLKIVGKIVFHKKGRSLFSLDIIGMSY